MWKKRTNLLHNGCRESRADTSRLRVLCKNLRSCTAGNRALSCSIGPCSLLGTGRSFRGCTSLRSHTFCRTLDPVQLNQIKQKDLEWSLNIQSRQAWRIDRKTDKHKSSQPTQCHLKFIKWKVTVFRQNLIQILNWSKVKIRSNLASISAQDKRRNVVNFFRQIGTVF